MKHLCIVSDQLMPNFLPCLDANLCPDEVTLIVSDVPNIRKKAEYFKSIIRTKGISISDDIVVTKTYDVNELQSKLLKWVETHENDDYCLNATGGTKVMSFVAYEALREFNIPVFYIEISTDEVVWLTQHKPATEVEQIRKLTGDKPTLHQYFTLNGITVESKDESQINQYWQGLIKTFVDKQNEWQHHIGLLNKIASNLEQTNSLRNNESVNIPQDLLEALHANELIKYENNNRFEFKNVEARYFCNGGWLEEYVYQTLMNLIKNNRRVQKNVKINSTDKTLNFPNELDVVTLYKNTCFVFECKTKNLKEEQTVNDIIYKLQAIIGRRLALRTKGVIVSYRNVLKQYKERAEGFGIKIIDDLSRLEELLKQELRFDE